MGVANLAAQIRIPREGESYYQAGTGASARYEIPAEWKGRYVYLVGEGDYLRINFGDSSVVCTDGAASTLSGETLTANNETGRRIPADLVVDLGVVSPSNETDAPTHFAIYQSTAGAWTMGLNDRQG